MTKTAKPTPGPFPIQNLDTQARELIEQVMTSGCSLVLTSDGQPAVVLVEARVFEAQQRRLALLERIVQGERDFADGRTHSQEEVEALLDEWLSDGA